MARCEHSCSHDFPPVKQWNWSAAVAGGDKFRSWRSALCRLQQCDGRSCLSIRPGCGLECGNEFPIWWAYRPSAVLSRDRARCCSYTLSAFYNALGLWLHEVQFILADVGSMYEAVKRCLCFDRYWSVALCRYNFWNCLKWNVDIILHM